MTHIEYIEYEITIIFYTCYSNHHTMERDFNANDNIWEMLRPHSLGNAWGVVARLERRKRKRRLG